MAKEKDKKDQEEFDDSSLQNIAGDFMTGFMDMFSEQDYDPKLHKVKGDVRGFQNTLIRDGYLAPGSADGIYGPETHKAYNRMKNTIGARRALYNLTHPVETVLSSTPFTNVNLMVKDVIHNVKDDLYEFFTGEKQDLDRTAPITKADYTKPQVDVIHNTSVDAINKKGGHVGYGDISETPLGKSSMTEKLLDPAEQVKTTMGGYNAIQIGDDVISFDQAYNFNDGYDYDITPYQQIRKFMGAHGSKENKEENEGNPQYIMTNVKDYQ